MPDENGLPAEFLEKVLGACDAFERRLDAVEVENSLNLARPDDEPPSAEPVLGAQGASELEQVLEEEMPKT